ncbi:MAG: hypothetical protein V4724_16320 [Pseudomonadota bacterium]
MVGKFMMRGAIVDMIKSEERTNAIQKRNGTNFAVTATVCGCPDPNCGGWHTIREERTLPTADEADATLKQRKAAVRVEKEAPTAQPSNQPGRAGARRLS